VAGLWWRRGRCAAARRRYCDVPPQDADGEAAQAGHGAGGVAGAWLGGGWNRVISLALPSTPVRPRTPQVVWSITASRCNCDVSWWPLPRMVLPSTATARCGERPGGDGPGGGCWPGASLVHSPIAAKHLAPASTAATPPPGPRPACRLRQPHDRGGPCLLHPLGPPAQTSPTSQPRTMPGPCILRRGEPARSGTIWNARWSASRSASSTPAPGAWPPTRPSPPPRAHPPRRPSGGRLT